VPRVLVFSLPKAPVTLCDWPGFERRRCWGRCSWTSIYAVIASDSIARRCNDTNVSAGRPVVLQSCDQGVIADVLLHILFAKVPMSLIGGTAIANRRIVAGTGTRNRLSFIE
jgi:hypothetical protein